MVHNESKQALIESVSKAWKVQTQACQGQTQDSLLQLLSLALEEKEAPPLTLLWTLSGLRQSWEGRKGEQISAHHLLPAVLQ